MFSGITCTGVAHLQENAHPTEGLCLRSWGSPGGWAFSYGRGTPVCSPRRPVQHEGGEAGLLIRKHDHFTPTRKIRRHVKALARNHPEEWKVQCQDLELVALARCLTAVPTALRGTSRFRTAFPTAHRAASSFLTAVPTAFRAASRFRTAVRVARRAACRLLRESFRMLRPE